ncbi:MAG: hypothetical protein HRU15_05030, partial [Planctomycetes bacterium]|nr:hypothetical protein [Planctomycetota bacterium]
YVVTVDRAEIDEKPSSKCGVLGPDGNWLANAAEYGEDLLVFDIPL